MDEKILKALCEPKRFLLLQLMSERGYCVGALARKSQLSESAVSQHLRVLREAGLVIGEKRGYYTHYRLDKDALGAIIDELSALRSTEHARCSHKKYYGCSEAEHVRCNVYVPSEQKEKEEKEEKR
jgi:ArsR family transcriptional regulator